jgi:hypothetical protein
MLNKVLTEFNETILSEENLYSYILIDRMYHLFLDFVVSDLCIKT